MATSDVFAQKVNFLMPRLQKDLGITKEQAAGIVGSLAAETGGFKHYQELTPVGHRGGWGWAQWTGKRRRAFEKKYGVGNKSDEANYGMLVHELKSDPYWSKELTRIKKAKTVSAAARAFTGSSRSGTGYLRPGREHYAASDMWAHKAMEVLARKKAIMEGTEAEPEAPTVDNEKEMYKEQLAVYEKTLQLISLTRIVEVDEVNTMKLRAVVNAAEDALKWAETISKENEEIPLDNDK
jgi:hypothetical protein